MAEGTPLLREHAVKSCIEGSNPSLTAIAPASVAQLDRVLGYEPSGQRFESSRMHHHYPTGPEIRARFAFPAASSGIDDQPFFAFL